MSATLRARRKIYEWNKKGFLKKIGLIMGAIFLLIYTFNSSFSKKSPKQTIIPHSSKDIDPEYEQGDAKGVFITLTRNFNLWDLLQTMRDIEDRFNHKYHYDWVFLNDEDFSREFIKETTRLASGTTKYGKIPKEHWSIPDYVDEEKAAQARIDMKDIIYGDSLPYRHMCRYNSGFFYRHPLLEEYDYYWRVDHDVKFYCDINYDIFEFFKVNKLKYGFVMTMHEYLETCPTLWDTTLNFIKENPEYVAKDNLLDFVSNDDGKSFNGCHFWSNFEVGDLNFLRSKAYEDYFNYLDHNGGFFYERWGDAPVHSIAASLLLNKDEVHFFEDIGYYHNPYANCPIRESIRESGKCICSPFDDKTFIKSSCVHKYFELKNLEKPEAEMKRYGFSK